MPLAHAGVQLGDRGEVDVVVDLERDADGVGEPLEQVGVVPAGEVAGVAQPPGARVECARRPDHERGAGRPRSSPAAAGAPSSACTTWATASAPGRRGVRSSYSPTVRPVRSATAARIRVGVTSSAATYAASGLISYSWALRTRAAPGCSRSATRARPPRAARAADDAVGFESPVSSPSWVRESGPCSSRRSSAARSLMPRSEPGRARPSSGPRLRTRRPAASRVEMRAAAGRGDDRRAGHVEGGFVGLPGADVVDVSAALAVEAGERSLPPDGQCTMPFWNPPRPPSNCPRRWDR